MGFKEDIQKLAVQIVERKQHIANEQTAKQSLIMPFFQALGFDVYDPREVRPEYMADFGKKRGEKVDYALFRDGVPIMFVEAKLSNDELVGHDAQLSRYFNSTPEVRFGVLTNGLIYKFFTDLAANNIMDTTPFLIIDMANLNDASIEALANFRKESFDVDKLIVYAEETTFTASLNAKIKDILKNPPDDFVRYLIKDFSGARITSAVLERFRPLVRKAISHAILDIVSKGILTQNNPPDVTSATAGTDVAAGNQSPRGIVTTEEELRGFELVRSIIGSSKRDTSQIKAKDNQSYYAIYNRVITEWFLRLHLSGPNKFIVTLVPLETAKRLAQGFRVEETSRFNGESRVLIKSVDDLLALSPLIIESYKLVEPQPQAK